MKHLLTGVAMAAALAIAAPVWAQNAPPSAPSAPPAAPAMKSMAKPMMKTPMHHTAMHHKGMSSGDKMTEDLNKQELARIMGGGAPPMASAPNMTPGGNNPTSGTAGPFAPPPPAK